MVFMLLKDSEFIKIIFGLQLPESPSQFLVMYVMYETQTKVVTLVGLYSLLYMMPKEESCNFRPLIKEVH